MSDGDRDRPALFAVPASAPDNPVMHKPQWVQTDPTGGDPWMGGPVTITVCAVCGSQKPTGWHLPDE